MVRTFAPRAFAPATTGASFELTRDDFLRIFAIGREVHINLSPEDGLYEMNIGFTNLANIQAWQLPDIAFEGPSIWKILDPVATPHSGLFPEATHVLVSTNDQIAEGTVYLFYNFAETELVLLGEAVEPPDAQPLETYQYNYPLTLFPMNVSMGFTAESAQVFEGIDAIVTQDVGMHGFGTFSLNDQETLTAGTFYDDIVYWENYETAPEILTYETHYSIFAEDGTWFGFYIADPPEGDSTNIEGDVYIEAVEYWRVVDPNPTSVEQETPMEALQWAVYPNPATDEIRFSVPMSVVLYDVLGRTVGSGTAVQRLDVSGLSPGLYLVRSETGPSKPLIIQ